MEAFCTQWLVVGHQQHRSCTCSVDNVQRRMSESDHLYRVLCGISQGSGNSLNVPDIYAPRLNISHLKEESVFIGHGWSNENFRQNPDWTNGWMDRCDTNRA